MDKAIAIASMSAARATARSRCVKPFGPLGRLETCNANHEFESVLQQCTLQRCERGKIDEKNQLVG